MRRNLALIGVLLVLLSACGSKGATTTPVDVSAVQTSVVQTVFTGATQTAVANVPTDTPVPTATATFAMTVNGQLQGLLAFIRNDNLWVSINGTEIQLTTDAISTDLWSAQLWYSKPQISPDGTKIAYRKQTYDTSTYTTTSVLMVSDIDGKNARQLANNVGAVEWSNDSQKIYYSISNGYDRTTGLEAIILKSVNPTTGDVAEHGQFSIMTGCGGGSSDMADHVSGNEGIGYLGKGKIFILSPQNNYLAHSTSCDNGLLGVLDLSTKQDRVLGNDSTSAAAISADGSKIAAISGNNIVIFNAISGNIEQVYYISEPPRALAWGHNDTAIFYSTSKSAGTQDLDSAVALEVFGTSPMTITLNVSTLWRLSLDNGESIKIIDMDAHDLKPIFATDQTVLVGAIENNNALFDYITQGNRENIKEHFPSINLVEVNLASLTSNVITRKTGQADYVATK